MREIRGKEKERLSLPAFAYLAYSAVSTFRRAGVCGSALSKALRSVLITTWVRDEIQARRSRSPNRVPIQN